MATKTKKTRKKVDLDSLSQIDGALAPSPAARAMLADDSGYSTEDLNTYLTEIRAMSDADLQDHAVKVMVTPISHRERLEDRLEKQFITKTSGRIWQPKMVDFSEEALARQKRLLRGGY